MSRTDTPAPAPAISVARLRVTRTGREAGERKIPEETAIAFTYGRATYAVMMATPKDLEDFAVGFSLTERIIDRVADIAELDVVHLPLGVELRMILSGDHGSALQTRRRNMAGPAGCGLCGIESLDAAMRAPASVSSQLRIPADTIFRAMHELHARQVLNAETHAVHAAGFWPLEDEDFTAVREDVGRHNALDKLAGALARAGHKPEGGFIALTSRVSIELVQKAAAIGCPLIAAVSAPTGFAVRAAQDAGLTLIAIARDDSFEIFTHGERITGP